MASRRRRGPAERRALEKLIDEACVDAYNHDEQEGGFLVGLEEHLRLPVRALVIGEEVEVVAFDQCGGEPGVMAVCRRKGRKYHIPVTSLAWPGPPPSGAEWIDAHRLWLGDR